jgi:hypothetical protein
MGNTNCCNLSKYDLFKREKIVIEDISPKVIKKIIRVQAYWRAAKYRDWFRIKHQNKSLRVILSHKTKTKTARSEGFEVNLMPGTIVEIDSIKIHENVSLTEQKLGDFVIEEKELIRYIENHKNMLKNYSILYQDGSIYYGYFSKSWEREGYGVLIFPDGAKYQGFFKNNKMHGRGRLVGIEGDYYEGNIY